MRDGPPVSVAATVWYILIASTMAITSVRAQCPDGTPPPCEPRAVRRVRNTTPPPTNSVAVLTFENRSRNASGVVLADGLADEIATRLAQVTRLLVTSRAAVRRLRGTDTLQISDIRRVLDAAYLVTGNVQGSGPLVRVNVVLLNTATARQVWGQLFDDRRQEDLLAVQGEIAEAIAAAIVGQLLPLERTALITGAPAPSPALSQPISEAGPLLPKASVTPGAVAQLPTLGPPLFESDTAIDVTITTDLTSLIQNRDTLIGLPGVFSYVGSAGALQRIPLTIRAQAGRGSWRHYPRNCDFPPIQLNFESDSVRGTLVSDLTRLQITTTCRPSNTEYEEYVVQEYLVYRAFALITKVSRQTRLARITYRDALGKSNPITTWAFFLEEVSDLAKRVNRRGLSARRALFEDVEQEPLRTVSVFEYFVGNTNWSVAAENNIALLSDTAVKIMPVAYGFDFTGAVDPRYAGPDPRLGIRRVTERLYRGVCMKPPEFKATIDHFRARRANIDELFTTLPQISPVRAARMKGFFNDFWQRTDSSLQRELELKCVFAN